MENKFRLLKADEIECRPGNCTKNGYSILLYKDARCDMNILDETVGAMNWQRHHEVINGKEFCTVSLCNDEGVWVGKQDCGTKSNTESEKGESSDAFKRACVNWGIGRELYTAPFIWISGGVKKNPKKEGTYIAEDNVQNFVISAIEYDEKNRICGLAIVDGDGVLKYAYGTVKAKNPQPVQKKPQKKQEPAPEEKKNPKITEDMVNELLALIERAGQKLKNVLNAYNVDDVYCLPSDDYNNAVKTLEHMIARKENPQKALEDMLDQEGVPQ